MEISFTTFSALLCVVCLLYMAINSINQTLEVFPESCVLRVNSRFLAIVPQITCRLFVYMSTQK